MNAQPIAMSIFLFKFRRLLLSQRGDFIDLIAIPCITWHLYARASYLSNLVNSSHWGYANVVHFKILYFLLMQVKRE